MWPRPVNGGGKRRPCAAKIDLCHDPRIEEAVLKLMKDKIDRRQKWLGDFEGDVARVLAIVVKTCSDLVAHIKDERLNWLLDEPKQTFEAMITVEVKSNWFFQCRQAKKVCDRKPGFAPRVPGFEILNLVCEILCVQRFSALRGAKLERDFR